MAKSSWKYFERRIAKEIAVQWGLAYNENVLRTPGSGSMSNFKGDIIVIGEDFPLHIECKFGYDFTLEDIVKNTASIRAFVKQANTDAPKNKIPVVILSKPYYGVYVIIDLKFVNTNFPIENTVTKFLIKTEHYLVIKLDALKRVYEGGMLCAKPII
jgi:Holliday junction resolvase